MKKYFIPAIVWLLTSRETISVTENGDFHHYEFALSFRLIYLLFFLSIGWFLFGLIGNITVMFYIYRTNKAVIHTSWSLTNDKKLCWHHGR